MRILIISDTHTDSIEKLPNEIIKEMKNSDMIIHAGDLDDYTLVKQIKEINNVFYPVRGNMDSNINPVLLPRQRVIQAGSYSMGVIHGDGYPNNLFNRLLYTFTEQDIIIFGHTHKPYCEKINGKLLINPGSLLYNRGFLYNSYAILKISDTGFDAKIHFLDNDSITT